MSIKQVIVVRKDLNMRKGKMCAQVAHASLKIFLDRIGYIKPRFPEIKHDPADNYNEEKKKNQSAG